jgi:cytochrome c-type biogenesis protein CcmE
MEGKYMTRIGKYSGTLFLQTRLLPCAFLVGYAVLHGYLLVQGSLLDYRELGAYLNTSQSVGVLLFLLFSLLSFEFLFLARASHLDECLEANREMHLKFRWCQLGLLLPLILLSSVTVFCYDLFGVASFGALTGMVLKHLVLCCVLNILLVELVAVLLGSVLASAASRPVSYCVIIVASFLMSPVAKTWFSLIPFPYDSLPFDAVRIIDFFSITAPDTDWVPDPNYGLALESCRWDLVLFWISLLFALFLLLNRPRKRKRYGVMIGALLAVCVVGAIGFFQMGQDSVVRLDNRLWGTSYSDSTYRYTHEEQEEEADFRILTYQIDLSVQRKLYADVSLTVTHSEDSDHYLFTLYHGYKITSLTDGSGNSLDYTRDGNYLDVVFPLTDEEGQINICYQGSGNRYYSNSQGIALPGYFPWYPMAGYLTLWDSETSSTHVNLDPSSKEFYLTVDSSLPLVSNLEEVSEHSYAGSASAVTLIGGFLTQVEENGFTYYTSPLNPIQLNLEELQEKLEEAEQTLDVDFGINLDQTTIITMPEIITRTAGGSSETFVAYPDHLLVANDRTDLVSAALDTLLPRKSDAQELRDLLVFYLMVDDSEETLYGEDMAADGEKPAYADVAALISPDESSDLTISQVYFEQLFRYQINQLGRDTVLRACYQYLSSEDSRSQVDFLYDLAQ